MGTTIYDKRYRRVIALLRNRRETLGLR